MKLYEKMMKETQTVLRRPKFLCFRMALIKELTKRSFLLHSYGASKFNVLLCFAACSLPSKVKINSDVIEEEYNSVYFVFIGSISTEQF